LRLGSGTKDRLAPFPVSPDTRLPPHGSSFEVVPPTPAPVARAPAAFAGFPGHAPPLSPVQGMPSVAGSKLSAAMPGDTTPANKRKGGARPFAEAGDGPAGRRRANLISKSGLPRNHDHRKSRITKFHGM
jgi:hypothetical protein